MLEPDIRTFQRTIIDIPLKSVLVKESVQASARESVDLMNLNFVLCHEGYNSRGDRFNANELRASWRTPIFKPINWEHKEPVIGCIANSALKKDEEGKLFIECEGKIWKFVYDDFASLIAEAVDRPEGPEHGLDLGFISMEAWFTNYNMIVGEYDEVYARDEKRGQELHDLRGTCLADGRFISRELANVIFGAAAVTTSPADKDAVIKSVASKRTPEEWHMYLHRVFAGEIQSPLTESQIIKEHDRLHREFIGM